MIAERQAKPGEHQDDLLDLMLNNTDDETGEKLDPVNIRNQVLTFLVAGNETTAGTIAFALYFLALHPEIADAARAEVADITGGEAPAFEDVAKMRYLRRVVDETLRLWPSAPGYFRKVRTDTTLGGRYAMPKDHGYSSSSHSCTATRSGGVRIQNPSTRTASNLRM